MKDRMKEDWKYCTIGELCNKTNGLWKGKKEPFVNVGVIRNANFTKDFSLSFDNIEYLDVEEKQYKTRKLYKGDLIVEKSGGSEKQPVGRTVLFDKEDGEYSFSNFTSVLRIKDRRVITPEFLYKYILYVYLRGDMRKMQKATTGIHNIEFDKYLSIEVPTIPLSEQQDIVRYLDESFAKIDALKVNAEKSLADAKALFQAELKKAMEPKEGWEEKKLGEVADIKGGKRVPKGYKLQSEPTLHKYIRVADFNDCGSVDLSDIQYISDDVFEQIKRYTISTEDVYISIAGTIGKSGIIPEELEGANLTENACKLVLDKNLDKRFVYYFTQSNLFKKQIDILTKKSAQPKLALTRLAIVELAYPSLSEQQSIVTHLDTLSAKVTQLQQNLEKIKTECDALKQALLKQVFK